MTEEEEERAREKYNTMKKGLQLTPIEKALVIIITDDQTELVQKFCFDTTDVEELEMLAASLTKTLYDVLKKENMSQEEHLSFSNFFFEEVKDKYKERFLKS